MTWLWQENEQKMIDKDEQLDKDMIIDRLKTKICMYLQAGSCNPFLSWTWEITKLGLGIRVGALESVEADADPMVVAINVNN